MLAARRDCIIHSHVLTPASHLFVLSAWAAGCQNLVSSYHNNEPHLANPSTKWRLQLMDRVTRRTIAISKSVRDHLVLNVGLSPSKTRIVYYGLPMPSGERSKPELRASLGVPADKFLVGFMGRLIEQKDIPTMLRALGHVPEVQGVIVGGGPLEGALKAEAQKLNLANVVFVGSRPNGPELIGCFDVMVLCSVFEGLGLVLLEAMSRRVPIIGTKAGAIPEILANGEQGKLIEVGDDKALAQAIRELQGKAGSALAEKAYHYVEQGFTISAMVNNTLALYEEARGTATPGVSLRRAA
jgi:glycosyltransferase involved in cell wall biosynthesis